MASKCERCGDTGYDTQGAFCLCHKGQTLMLEGEVPASSDPRKEVWQKVFQVISDCEYRNERELIKLLEASREEDGYGPRLK